MPENDSTTLIPGHKKPGWELEQALDDEIMENNQLRLENDWLKKVCKQLLAYNEKLEKEIK